MIWFSEKDLKKFVNQYDYDIRKSGNARWIDQKCTADVLSIIADCIINFMPNNNEEYFSSKDIWYNDYTIKNVENIFRKAKVDGKSSINEYDKFFQQPMELLSYANVLLKKKIGSRNFYKINNKDLLEYIALRERNALTFLQIYIEKVLHDSELWSFFENFFKYQSNTHFTKLKNTFETFTITYTKINKELECRRIFTKILNPLAFKNNTKGTSMGHLSKDKISYDELMYNRDNFRDIYSKKPKGITRKEYEKDLKINPNPNYYKYLSQKAKRFLRLFNWEQRNGKSEIKCYSLDEEKTIHIHHIFPEADFPEISFYYENLIALSANQHFVYAHPNGNTHSINTDFQQTCLLAKTESIKENILHSDAIIYDFKKFMYVLNTGFDTDAYSEIENLDFDGVITKISLQFII